MPCIARRLTISNIEVANGIATPNKLIADFDGATASMDLTPSSPANVRVTFGPMQNVPAGELVGVRVEVKYETGNDDGWQLEADEGMFFTEEMPATPGMVVVEIGRDLGIDKSDFETGLSASLGFSTLGDQTHLLIDSIVVIGIFAL